MGISPAAVLFDSNGNPVTVINDSGTYRLSGAQKVLNSSGSQIDPSTETTLAGVKTNQESVLDSGNSSTSQLASDGTFVGTGVDCLGFSAVAVTVHSDKDSADGGMKFQFSMDNTNWDDSYDWTLDASSSTTRRFQFPICARYFRVNYTNDNQATTEFRCQTILQRQNILTSIHRLQSASSPDRSAQVVKSAIIAQRTGGSTQNFIPVEADPGGNLKVSSNTAPPNPQSINNDYVKNVTNNSLLVDGSVTPVVFTFNAHATLNASVQEVVFVIAANSVTFGTNYFGSKSGPLTNGLKIEVTSDGQTGTVALLKQNEDFVHFSSPGGFQWVVSSKDMMSSQWLAGGGFLLYGGTADNIKVTVQDDLSSAAIYFKCFVKTYLLEA